MKHRLNHVPLSFEDFIPVACGEQVALYPGQRVTDVQSSGVQQFEQYHLFN